jgi:hypothetical protein
MEKQIPLLTIKPQFDPALTMVEAIPAGIAGTTIAVFLGGTFFFILLNIIGLGKFMNGGSLYSTFLVLGLALTPAIYYELKKSAYRRTVYHFYEDSLEYQDFKFFLTRRRGRVRLRDITDVTARATFLQSRRTLTTIYLTIPGFSPIVQGILPGLKIMDVPEKGGLQDKILDLVEQSSQRYYSNRNAAQPAPPVQMPM